MSADTVLKSCHACATDLVTIYALFCDTIRGFGVNADTMELHLSRNPSDQQAEGREFYGSSVRSSNYLRLHALCSVTHSEFIENNRLGGLNHVLAAQQFVTNLYARWEHYHRIQIASALGMKCANELKVDIIGEIRELRNDILHHHGIIQNQTITKLRILAPFCVLDEQLCLSDCDVYEIVCNILTVLDDMVIKEVGEDPGWRHGTNLDGPIQTKLGYEKHAESADLV